MAETFIYVTYIRTTPEKLWNALTRPEFTREYWFGATQDCRWEAGSPWELRFADGSIADRGEVLEIEPPNHLVLSWSNVFRPECAAEGATRASFTLEPAGENVKLTVKHEIDRDNSVFLKALSNGWPLVLSSLKSLLETGQPLEGTDRARKCAAG